MDKYVLLFRNTRLDNNIYRTSFETTKEPYLQSFQYKIINIILNSKERLHKWKIMDNNKCYVCDEVDSIEHHLFFCKISKIFWIDVKKWMVVTLDFGFEFTICEVLFCFAKHVPDSNLLYFLILMGKWYINTKKSEEKTIMFFKFLITIKNKI